MGPADDHCIEVHYIPLMAIIPRRDLFFAMRYISNLPANLGQSILTEFLSGFNYLRCGWRPGDVYAPVVFKTLEEATRAYKELAGRKLEHSTVRLSWKIPNTIVYIMNIQPETPSPRIRQLLQGYRLYGNLVRRPHMMIVAFRDPEEAEIAVNRLQGTNVDGELLQLSVLRGQHASEFVGYERSLSCYMCLRTLKSGARAMSITATPPLALASAVKSAIYCELSFNLGENPQIALHDSQVLPAVTSRDIALRIRCIGHAARELGFCRGAEHCVRLMEILRGDISDSGGMMDVGVVLEDPLDALKVEKFFGESVPLASRVVPRIRGELRPYYEDTAGESSGHREYGRQRGGVLYSGAFNKPGPPRRASVGSGRISPPNPGGSSGVSPFSDPRLKVRQFPFFSTQPTASIMRPLVFGQRQPGLQLLPDGGENTMVGLIKDSENGEKGPEDGEGTVEAMEDQRLDAPPERAPERADGRGNGLLLPKAHKRSSSESASSSWSFLHRSYNSQTIPSSSSSASVRSVGESVTQAFGQMQYTDDSDSEATDSALAEIVDLTVDNGKEGGKSDKSGDLGRERRPIPIVDSSESDSQSGLGSRVTKAERSTGKKGKSKRKEKVLSGESIASESGEEPPVTQRRKHKSGKKGKRKEVAHSDGSMEFKSDRDEPGPSKPRKKSSKHKRFPKQVESASDYESPALVKVKKKKKKKAEETEEVREGSDVDMDASDPPMKQTPKKRRGRQSSVSESEDAIHPVTEGVSETRVAHGRRPKPPANTSSSDPKAKKRKRNRTSSTPPIPTPVPPPPPANLSPSPARPGESMDAAFRRREIEKKIHHINLQQHELSVRESGLKHELKKLKYQARVEADVQGTPYCMCSACGEYGHNRSNRAKCKRHPKYVDWYPDR
ncbi:hypothetical protein B9Z19DRAFT_1175846 [Tuber borchii]|uniref:RRM domain-containing protein n=1 Tax=Tuber borchii TaxID=42251 RepID=A0A2T6ZVJ3_TUBBO|nr:hypothetical protein B9Z19DRAFT_1175846 [Tuber borchii]